MYLYLDKDNYVIGYGSDYEPDSYKVDSVPFEVDQYLGAYKFNKETEEYIPDNNKKNWLNRLNSTERELDQLLQWFNWYDQQYIQWQRSQRLNLSFNQNMEKLDAQATLNAQKIIEYREFLATPYSPPQNNI